MPMPVMETSLPNHNSLTCEKITLRPTSDKQAAYFKATSQSFFVAAQSFLSQ
jgi:hypothetical protein